LSFGQENGVIKDFDTRTNQIIRRAELHSN